MLGRTTDLFADPSGDRNVNGSSCGEHEEVSKVHGKLLISFGSDDLGQMVDLDNEYWYIQFCGENEIFGFLRRLVLLLLLFFGKFLDMKINSRSLQQPVSCGSD